MPFRDEIAADLAELESEFNASFSWNGADYPCVPGSMTRDRSLASGGLTIDADLILFARADVFTSANLALLQSGTKNKLTFESRSYRIEQAVVPATSPFVKLICVEAAKGL